MRTPAGRSFRCNSFERFIGLQDFAEGRRCGLGEAGADVPGSGEVAHGPPQGEGIRGGVFGFLIKMMPIYQVKESKTNACA